MRQVKQNSPAELKKEAIFAFAMARNFNNTDCKKFMSAVRAGHTARKQAEKSDQTPASKRGFILNIMAHLFYHFFTR